MHGVKGLGFRVHGVFVSIRYSMIEPTLKALAEGYRVKS